MRNNDLLIVIDMQNVYKEGEAWGCCNTKAASEAIRRLLDADVCGAAVFTRFDAPRDPRGSWKALVRVPMPRQLTRTKFSDSSAARATPAS